MLLLSLPLVPNDDANSRRGCLSCEPLRLTLPDSPFCPRKLGKEYTHAYFHSIMALQICYKPKATR